ncbi:electron transfer flavoprotein subunit alpha/FixB family protein [Arcanobacterium haemolyticum]|nr:electron transfer flavoprotein subunit alpha/FixB family protein [Arcanobacterium haemolyticum]
MKTWIITADERISALVETARAIGGDVVAVVAGNAEVTGVDSVLRVELPADAPAEAAAPAVAQAVAAEAGDIVLAANRPAERVLAGFVAASLNAPVLSGAVKIASGSAELAMYGGISLESVSFSSPVVAILDAGVAGEGAPAAAETVAGETLGATVVSVDKQDVAQVNLAAAKRIVAAGRGFKSEDDLGLARDLCEAFGAELACSRPLAEGTNWLPRDRYVGVSGQVVAPEVYVAVGISGQVQHTAGMNNSKIVVAINEDDKAPIFEAADYGIVGDLYTVLPALTAALR